MDCYSNGSFTHGQIIQHALPRMLSLFISLNSTNYNQTTVEQFVFFQMKFKGQ